MGEKLTKRSHILIPVGDSQEQVTSACPHCGGFHPDRTCPRIRAVEYHPDGTVKRIEFHEPMIGFQLPGWVNAPVPTGSKP